MKKYPELDDYEWLRNIYVVDNKSTLTISKFLGCSYNTVRDALNRHGIKLRDYKESSEVREEHPSKNKLLEDKDLLERLYIKEQKTIDELCSFYSCSFKTLYRTLDRYGIETRKVYTPKSQKVEVVKKQRGFPILKDKEYLYKKFQEERMLLKDLASEIGCSPQSLYGALKNLGIHEREKPNPPKKERSNRTALMYDEEWLRNQYVTLERSKAEIAQEMGIKESTVQRQLTRMGVSKRKMKPKKEWPSNSLGPGRKWAEGYIKRYLPSHPNAQRGGWILEHRVVAEEALGRYLSKQEEVHHLNEKRDDNRIENLIVFPTKHDHINFHHNSPSWMPRCPHCNKPAPEELTGRPENVPLLWTEE